MNKDKSVTAALLPTSLQAGRESVMKIQLMKPLAADWMLVASQATIEEIAAFDAAFEKSAGEANADEWCRKVETPQEVSVWTLRVEPFLAVFVAFGVGKLLGQAVEIANIGDTEFRVP